MATDYNKIFKAYDIRGVYPHEIDNDGAYRIAKGYATYLIGLNPKAKKLQVVVGKDMRLSSPDLAERVMAGLLDSGIDVIDIGLSSTPVFYFAVSEGDYDGGLQVSASHNPSEYNGIKIVRKKSYPVSLDDGLDIIRDLAISDEFKCLENKAIITKDDSVLQRQVDYSLKFDNFNDLKPLKIVADPANSMGALDLSALFDNLPCKLEKMNFKLDGTFPSHQADPFQESNIVDLKKEVVNTKADLGIATDGDGDRIFFIDEKGELIDPSILRGLLAKIILRNNKNGKIGYDIRPGRITRDMILENGGIPFVTRVGHSIIKAISIKKGAVFSGESSGHFFIKTKHGFFETPLLVALYIMREISIEGKKISEIIAPFKKYSHSGEINFLVDNKGRVMSEFEKKFRIGAKNVDHLDGITIEHDQYWMNVRPSNTESLLRLNLEAINKKVMEAKRDEISDFIISLGGSLASH
jgi:phosphomannomutase